MRIEASPGAVTRVPGYRAAGVACGLKQSGQLDLALVLSDHPATAAGVFTTNVFRAAPVLYDEALLAREHPPLVRAVVINAGNANACTGAAGLQDAERMARITEEALGLPRDTVLVMSTGVIGHRLPMDRVEQGIYAAAQSLSTSGGAAAARAIMTTDLVPKEAYVRIDSENGRFSIGGMAKGSGMIHPALARPASPTGNPYPHATMLCLIVSDARVSAPVLQDALDAAVARSFNRITVDGDTSTNDTVLLLASGQENATEITPDSEAHRLFQAALNEVCTSLAKQIARDGEGATRLVEITVCGAISEFEAERAAKTIATSPLVKTAIFGADPNWGRILAAVGRSNVHIDPQRTDLWLGPVQLVAAGTPLDFDVHAARAMLRQPEVAIRLDLGLGSGTATVWTCDLSYKYIEINAEYHT
ncbi:MAG: ornithine acetyltransferase [Ardenticatenia bacterium]|nr:MAG: ornithine acetyltransferase [Ardenticatenia bacterium]